MQNTSRIQKIVFFNPTCIMQAAKLRGTLLPSKHIAKSLDITDYAKCMLPARFECPGCRKLVEDGGTECTGRGSCIICQM